MQIISNYFDTRLNVKLSNYSIAISVTCWKYCGISIYLWTHLKRSKAKIYKVSTFKCALQRKILHKT